MKIPSGDWTEHFEHYIIEEESDNEIDDEPDFSEYLWMENEEEFDKSELQRLEDEETMKDCLDSMVDDEIQAHLNEWSKQKSHALDSSYVAASSACVVENSLLNPLAAEFVPQSSRVIIEVGSS